MYYWSLKRFIKLLNFSFLLSKCFHCSNYSEADFLHIDGTIIHMLSSSLDKAAFPFKDIGEGLGRNVSLLSRCCWIWKYIFWLMGCSVPERSTRSWVPETTVCSLVMGFLCKYLGSVGLSKMWSPKPMMLLPGPKIVVNKGNI